MLSAHEKLHDVAQALERLNLQDSSTAFGLFVYSWSLLRANGWGAVRIIEAGLMIEKGKKDKN
jgi:uncharacterized membrane protein YfhO